MRVASSIFVHIESVFRRVSSAAKWSLKLGVDSSLKLNVHKETLFSLIELRKRKFFNTLLNCEHPLRGSLLTQETMS